MNELALYLSSHVMLFFIIFLRLGTAFMIMPGIGDSFTPQNIRLYLALGFSVMLAPLLAPHINPILPNNLEDLIFLLGSEFLIGLFIGTVARIFMATLDVTGMVISIHSGLANAQLFNPVAAAQGSIIGAFLSVTGVVLIFASGVHYLMIYGLVESYKIFLPGTQIFIDDMALSMAKALSAAFTMGIQLASPFIIVTLLVYTGMGILGRLMPQIQVFILALPIQITVAMSSLTIISSTLFMIWLNFFRDGFVSMLTP